MLSRRRWAASVAVALVVATAVMLWAGLQWAANFDSDEAVFGLMAKHTLRGEIPTYRYGLAYLGSLESFVAAAFVAVIGHGVMPLRLSSLAIYLVFLALHALLAKRTYGAGVSAISTLLLALPARWVLEWVYRPMGFSTILPFGTAALLLATLQPRGRLLARARVAAIGLLAGLTLWSNPSGMLYFVVLGVVAVLGSTEWRRLRTLPRRSLRAWPATIVECAMPVVVLSAAALALTAVFADGCDDAWTRTAGTAKVVLAAAVAALAVALAALSRRRLRLIGGGAVLGLGLAVGSLPVWRAWLFYGVPLARAIMPSCPEEVPDRASLVYSELLPALAGGFPVAYLPHAPSWQAALWLAVAAIGLAVAVALLWSHGGTAAALLRAAPLQAEAARAATLMLLFALPVLLTALGSNTMDLTSTRYLLISWHAGATAFALLVVGRARAKRPAHRLLAALLVALWAAQVVLVSYRTAQLGWTKDRLAYAPERVAALERYLGDHGVSAGYAGYWTAFALDYLWDERIVLAPFSGSDRYPAYGRTAAAQPVQAYVLRVGAIPAGSESVSDLVAALEEGDKGAPGHPQVMQQLQGQTVIGRETVANWDVWLVAGRDAATAVQGRR